MKAPRADRQARFSRFVTSTNVHRRFHVQLGTLRSRSPLFLFRSACKRADPLNKDSYDVQTSSVSRSLKGKGKRTATFIGGGAGGGALIGGLAGGGKGALIGAALGAGAGTAGAAYTGDKEIVLPAESALSFTLTEPVTIKM